MAFISSEKVKNFRNAVKAAFPAKDGWKFSITGRNYSTICVDILAAPIDLSADLKGGSYITLNPYYLENYVNAEIYQKIKTICNEGNFDNSDSQSDYFHVGWYFDLSIGTYEKPFVFTGKTSPEVTKSEPDQTVEETDRISSDINNWIEIETEDGFTDLTPITRSKGNKVLSAFSNQNIKQGPPVKAAVSNLKDLFILRVFGKYERSRF